MRQDPEHDSHQQDHGSGAAQKNFGPVEQAQAQRLQSGPAIGRHFEHEGRPAAFQDARFQQARAVAMAATNPRT